MTEAFWQASRAGLAALAALAIGALFGPAGRAQDAPAPQKPEMAETCPGLVALDAAPRPQPAALRLAALAADEARITYVGHASFLIESPQLVRITTDYNDYVRPPVLPDIVTMNHAHSTHYTEHPDPRIKYVLRGWAGDEQPARIDLQYKDVRVRNVPTNIRDGMGGTERHGNSIFIFEFANLCIAHLGHLHHTLTQQQLNEIGRLDVVMFPIDGTVTLDVDGMIEVLQALKAPIMIPMHFFSFYTLDRFLERVRETWDVERLVTPSIVVSKTTLPGKPTVMVLPGH
jgi:L-ascorbate metabolism protein UlaG (beta-lactamase superfamily)